MAFTDMVTSGERRQSYIDMGLWDSSTLPVRVASHATGRPHSTAVVDREGTRCHTYSELQDESTRFACWLADKGIGAGDAVSIQLPNCYEFVVAAVGALTLGAVVNPLLPVYRRREITHALTVARSKVLLTPSEHRGYDHLGETQRLLADVSLETHHVVVSDRPPPSPALWFPFATRAGEVGFRTDASSVSELIFTSGTEAQPKAIMHTEQTANFSMRAASEHLNLDGSDVVWMPSPIGHSTGFNYGVRMALYHGLPLVLQDRWDPAVACDLVCQYKATYTLASTTFLLDLVTEAERRTTQLPSLRIFGCGGATVPAPLVRRAQDKGIHVLRLYGSTEVLVATWNRPDAPRHQKEETDGTPLDHVEVEVRGGTTGEPGEIYVRGPNTCVGFYQDQARTTETFSSDGWVRSGDLGTVDSVGALTIVGRRKEIIIRGGLNITPRDIEDLLVEFPEVERAAVVGIPDERLGERVCACVVLAAGRNLDLETIVSRLRNSGLATFKLPEQLEILDSLPTTASGKVQKFEIVNRLKASN